MKAIKKELWEKFFNTTVACALSFLCVAILAFGCSKDSEEQNSVFTLNSTQKEMTVGETFCLTVNGAQGEISYSSNKDTVATVDENGQITAWADGTAVITVLCGEEKAECTVTVSYSAEPQIKMDVSSSLIYTGLTRALNAFVWASGVAVENQPKLSYESSDPSVLSVSEEGVLSGISEGSASIQVAANYGDKQLTATKSFEVVDLCVIILPDEVSISLRGEKTFAELSADVFLGGELLTNPDGLSFSIDNEEIATVDEETGRINAVSRGETLLTATYGDVTEQTLIKVDNLPLKNEINSFADVDKYLEGIQVSSPGFSGGTALSEYCENVTVGGRTAYSGAFVKLRHEVPPPTRKEAYLRGERMQFNVKCLNDLKALKAEGYTEIIIPIYFQFEEETGKQFLEFWTRNYDLTTNLYHQTWTYFSYDIDQAIKDVTDEGELIFYVFNYSLDYSSGVNADMSVYLDAIFAVKGSAEIGIKYKEQLRSYNLVLSEGETLKAKDVTVEGIPDGVAYETYFVYKDGSSVALEKDSEILLTESGEYSLLIETGLSNEYSYRKAFSVLVVRGEIAKNEINTFSNETRVKDNVWANVYGIVGYSTASYSYINERVGGRMPTGAGFIKSTHHVPNLSYTEAWERGERLETRVRCFNDLALLKKAGYTKIVIPVYLVFEETTKKTSLPFMTNGNWEERTEVQANTWTYLEYNLEKAIREVKDGVLSIQVANWSTEYEEKLNVSISVYIDSIYVA